MPVCNYFRINDEGNYRVCRFSLMLIKMAVCNHFRIFHISGINNLGEFIQGVSF